jgi:hypothetical protein
VVAAFRRAFGMQPQPRGTCKTRRENAMTVRQTETPRMEKAVSLADYIVDRLAAEGINHCFGVAGDYVFPICNAVDSSAKVKWIGWSRLQSLRWTRSPEKMPGAGLRLFRG